MKPKDKPHYVNNADFSMAVVDYVKSANDAKEKGFTKPIVTNYIARCFLKIAEGLSHKANFVRYTYREEMVMDGVENCLKAILNYNLEFATRTGRPNAFAYFTQIVWYAFLRRIAKEKKQQDIKMSYLSKVSVEDLMGAGEGEDFVQTEHIVEAIRQRIGRIRETDNQIKIYAKEEKKKRKSKNQDSDLSDFLE